MVRTRVLLPFCSFLTFYRVKISDIESISHIIYAVRFQCALIVIIIFMTFVINILTPFMLLRFYVDMSKNTILNRMLPFRVAPKKLWCQKSNYMSVYVTP